MWIPKDAAEIEAAARAGELVETSSFDGKLALPAVAKKNIDIAIDVAAMSTDGGVLLYGVGEDEHERLTELAPIELAGADDRIAQVVQTGISEVPYIESREHPCPEDPSRGYLVVVVPQSARAPHQVTLGREMRFYGRGAKGNRILTEGEVARLYRRREEWEQDRDALLAEAVDRAPFPPQNGLAFLHGFVRPVAATRAIWDQAITAAGGRQGLLDALGAAARSIKIPSTDLGSAYNWRRRGADECFLSSATEDRSDPSNVADIWLSTDGCGRLFCGRAGDTYREDVLMIFEETIAGNLAAFLSTMAALFRFAGYYGHVDLGVAVAGLRGGISSQPNRSGAYFTDHDRYNADTYQRHDRIAAAEMLHAPETVTAHLLRDLFEATTGRDNYDPFARMS